jgi:hypothetical protein
MSAHPPGVVLRLLGGAALLAISAILSCPSAWLSPQFLGDAPPVGPVLHNYTAVRSALQLLVGRRRCCCWQQGTASP